MSDRRLAERRAAERRRAAEGSTPVGASVAAGAPAGPEAARQLVERSPLPIALLGADGTVRQVNEPFCRLFGTTRELAMGGPVGALVSAAGAPTLGSVLDRALRAGEAVRAEGLERRDPVRGVVRLALTAWPLEALTGSPSTLLVQVEDVTGLRRVVAPLPDETILASLARLAVPALGDWCAAYLVEADGVLRGVAFAHAEPEREPLLQEYLRRPLEPPEGDPAARVVRTGRPEGADDVPASVVAAIAGDPQRAAALRLLGMAAYASVPLVARGEVLGAVTVASVSAGRGGARGLRLAEALARGAAAAVDSARLLRDAREAERVREAFLARASHELRTPLTVVKGHLALLAGKLPGADPAAVSLVAVARRHVDQMTRLITDLLDASRLQAGRMPLELEPLDLGATVGEAVAQAGALASGKSLALSVAVGPGVSVEGDRRRLEQVLVNLLANAVRHTPSGGAIRVEARDAGDRIEVTVRDTGEGIPREALDRVFEPFYQVGSAPTGRQKARGGGAGLGLALVRGIVELHGGKIRAESEGPGRGSAFILTLPKTQAGRRLI